MIKASQILEEYYSLCKPNWTSEGVPVFVNPSQKEMRECGEFIRFFADAETKEVFVWNGAKAVHGDMLRHGLNRSLNSLKDSEIKGEASRSGSPVWVVDVGEFKHAYRSHDLFKRMKDYDWSWMNTYQIDMKSAQKELLEFYEGLF
jgi:hypothetical protein